MSSRQPSPHLPAKECWLHADVVVADSSIAGRGLVATSGIPAGSVVSRLGGRLVCDAELGRLFAAAARSSSAYVDTISVDDDLHLVLPPGRVNGCGNHSCDPNLWWVDAFTLAARRDIEVAEELTNDYATSAAVDGFAMPCACGSALCRGTVRGTD